MIIEANKTRALSALRAGAVKSVWLLSRHDGAMRRAGLSLKTRALLAHDRLLTGRAAP